MKRKKDMKFAYKIDSNCTNVTLSKGIVLREKESNDFLDLNKKLELTANLSNKQDFPTPESPIKTS